METQFKLISSGLSDIGLRRSGNEDNFFTDDRAGCYLVADGMGGAAAGEIASRIFTDAATAKVDPLENRLEAKALKLVKNIFLDANTEIRSHISNNPDHKGMGCTADLLLFCEHGFVLGHIGDSRTYRLRQEKLTRLTKDHSLVQDQVDQGLITAAEAQTHRLRNVISRAVGVNEQIEIDLIRGRYLTKDIFLLCSDGLTDMVSEESVKEILLGGESLAERSDMLIQQANAHGGRDNVTVVLVEVEV